MTLQEKYSNLLENSKTVTWLNKVRYNRGYLTDEEKKRLYKAEKFIEKLECLPKQLSL